jgi:hypothetical protein
MQPRNRSPRSPPRWRLCKRRLPRARVRRPRRRRAWRWVVVLVVDQLPRLGLFR